MGQTREQRVIKQLSNPPSVQKFTAVATDMYLPNHSGIKSHPEFKDAIADYVPYTGATTNVNLGTKNLTTTGTITAEHLKTTDDLEVADDILLGLGSVMNWNSGDITLTHSSNLLTLGGGNLALGSNTLTFNSFSIVDNDGELFIGTGGSDQVVINSGFYVNGEASFGSAYILKAYITTSDPDIEVLSPITIQRAVDLLATCPLEKIGISIFTDGNKLYAIKGEDYYEVPLTLIGKLPTASEGIVRGTYSPRRITSRI